MRKAGLKTLTVGISVIAGAALIARIGHWQIPGWRSDPFFGPFPNRNHTGHLLGVGGVLALGCALDSAHQHWRRALPWLGFAGVILAALVVNYSRGGLLVWFGGVAIWSAISGWTRKSWPRFFGGLSALLIAAAGVLLAGGATAARFAGGANSEVGFRAKIWSDTLDLIKASPWCGNGLGNFAVLFPFFRSASVMQEGVRHPESDWLWLASELGWLAVVLVAVALTALIIPAFPFSRGSQRRPRGAALSASIAAALHAIIDVPAHQLGCILPVLLVLATSRGNDEPMAEDGGSRRKLAFVPAALGWRGTAILLLVSSFWRPPQDAARAIQYSQSGRYADAVAAADRALKQTPLDWKIWFIKAGAQANLQHPLEALADFRRARLLEPHYAGIPLEEGRFWLRKSPPLALQAWRETLNRLGPDEEETAFSAMFHEAPDDSAFREKLLEIATDRPALQIAWFKLAPPNEAKAHQAKIAAAAEKVDSAHKSAFEKRANELNQ